MKLNFGDFRRKCQLPVMLAAGAVPIPLLICANKAPEYVGLLIRLLLSYVLMTEVLILIRGKLRLVLGIIGAAALAVLGTRELPIREEAVLLMMPLLAVGLLLGSLQIGGWEKDREINPALYVVGVFGHAVAQLLVNVERQANSELYEPFTGLLTTCFLIFLGLMLLALNRFSLSESVNHRQAVPGAMRRKNTVLTAAFFLLIVLLSSLPAVIRAIQTAWAWLMGMLNRLIAWLVSLLPVPEDVAGGHDGGGMDLGGLGEAAGPNRFAEIMEKIMIVVAVAALAVALVFLLRAAWKKLKVLAAWLIKRLNEYAAAATEDYVDEVSDTREDGDKVWLLGKRLGRRAKAMKPVDESALSPGERIRYRYLQLWLKHPEWKPENTARENLEAQSAQLYERARYSSHEISREQAEEFAQKAK